MHSKYDIDLQSARTQDNLQAITRQDKSDKNSPSRTGKKKSKEVLSVIRTYVHMIHNTPADARQ